MDNSDTLDRTNAMPEPGKSANNSLDSTFRLPDAKTDSTGFTPNSSTLTNDADRTLRPDGAALNQIVSPTEGGGQGLPSTFRLKGDDYEQLKLLSDNSGEAQVYLVKHDDKEYVLKVYYPNFNVDKNLLQHIRSFQFEMIVELIDYGKAYFDGKSRYYELMEYLRGGTLRDLNVEGDMKRFRRIALQGAAALAYCHKNNVLHKDVKPTNFFFRDEAKEQLVLGDFGISAMRESESQNFRTTQARTPIYAAPEMYIDVIDGEVEITPAADFYSLGITLFSTWLGENPMSSNERTMMKQKNEGRLPRLNELPESIRLLVQGLTAVNPQSRWGYDEVERWFKGEEVKADISSPYLKYKSFVVDPEHNLVADNVHELVPLLLANEKLAMNYLYNGQIVNWLTSCGNTRLSAIVSDIVTNRYPADQNAGLYAACYAMDPTLCYRDLGGVDCEDIHSVALSVLAYQEQYAMKLQNPNDPLFLWLESHSRCDVDRLRSYFKKGKGKGGKKQDDSKQWGRVPVLRLVYEIDPDVPFLSHQPSSTVKQIVNSFGTAQLTDDEWQSVCDGRLLSWMYGHKDMMAAEAMRILTHDQPYSKTLAYKVLYNLDREAAFDLYEADTPQAIGKLLDRQLQQAQHLDEEALAEEMKIYTDPSDRFYYYAQLHGWTDIITLATQCFDLNSEENRERLGAYDLRTALYHFCCILGQTPAYRLSDGTLLRNQQDINSKNTQQVRTEIRQGAFPQWLSVFYHENPAKDFAEEYSYEKALEAWLLALGRLDQQQPYYRRFKKACEDTKQRIEEVNTMWKNANRTEHVWQYIFYAACAIWTVLVCTRGLTDRAVLFEHPFKTVILPLGIATGIITGTRAYFKGFGHTLSVLAGIVGLATAAIPYFILKAVDGSMPDLFHIVVLVISAVYVAVSYFTDITRGQKSDAEQLAQMVRQEDIKTSLMEPLYYTFKTKSVRYKGSQFGLLDELNDHVRSMSGESVIHYVLWTLLAAVMIVDLCILTFTT